MADSRSFQLQNIDYITFCFYLALVSIGGVFIYSVDSQQSGQATDMASFLFQTQAGKQVIWIVISLLLFSFVVFVLDHKLWQVFAYPIYGFGLILLVLVLLVGSTLNGSTSWFTFGGFSFQPSELAKVGTCLAVAAYLGHWSVNLRNTQQLIAVMGLFFAPAALVLLQPDAGSGLVFMSFFIVLFREGLSPFLYIIAFVSAATFVLSILFSPIAIIIALAWVVLFVYVLYEERQQSRWLTAALALGVVFIVGYQQAVVWPVLAAALGGVLVMSYRQYTHFRTKLLPVVLLGFLFTSGLSVGSNYFFNEVLKPHQQQRIDVWLRPAEAKKRNKDSVMNLENSMLAIGAGGLIGRGVFSGRMTQGKWVPEQDTDFIFCTIGEEQGFVGTAAVVILYLLLLMRIILIAERQRIAFNRVYAYSVAGIFFVHILVNIGMTIGLLPIIGIPLPFISKGGSSLVGFTLMLAILIKLDMHNGRAKKNLI